jgi:hypothetical protein
MLAHGSGTFSSGATNGFFASSLASFSRASAENGTAPADCATADTVGTERSAITQKQVRRVVRKCSIQHPGRNKRPAGGLVPDRSDLCRDGLDVAR